MQKRHGSLEDFAQQSLPHPLPLESWLWLWQVIFLKKKFKKELTSDKEAVHAHCHTRILFQMGRGSGLIGMCRPDRGGIPDGAVCVVHAILRMFKAQIIISAFPASFKINNGARGHRKGLPRQAEEMLEGTCC